MRVIMLEFNELSPKLMDKFIALGHLPSFEQLRDKSACFVTDAQETPPNLEPWIQWVTVHTGLSFREHQCFHLNDGGSFQSRRIWDHVGAAGGKSWVCGSMNANFDRLAFRGHFLPDPWASDVNDFPNDYFAAFTNVVRTFVQEHSGRPQVSAVAMVAFAKFMLDHGLSIETIRATIAQLVDERLNPSKWRRAFILDRLQWDLFKRIYVREKPDFSTFFLNSTAHFQHFHWREMEPEIFTIKPSDEDQDNYRDAILEGYKSMDRIVGQATAMADPDTAIVLCTALSQQPMLTYEDDQGRQIFRHKDIKQLLDFAGVDETYDYAPVMSQEFLLHCQSDAQAASVAAKIDNIALEDGTKVMWAVPIGSKVDAGCVLNKDPGEALVRSPKTSVAMRFQDLFYPLESLRSGMHSPDGMFWVKFPGGEPQQHKEPVSLLRVYPTVLSLLGLDPVASEGQPLIKVAATGPRATVIA